MITVFCAQSESDPVAFTAAAARRLERALQTGGLNGHYGLGPIRESAADVPRLLALIADERLRAARVRALHEPFEVPGGRLLCDECSRPWEPAYWPCTTLLALDGDGQEVSA